jgi:hypothetical protein
MPVQVKLDDDLIERFAVHGVEATSVLGQGWQGISDEP